MLCGKLHKRPASHISDENKYTYYMNFKHLVDSMFVQAPEEHRATNNYVTAQIFNNAISVAPSIEAEDEMRAYVLSLLPQIPEDRTIFDFYLDAAKMQVNIKNLSKAKKKKIKNAQSFESRAVIRAALHLGMLRNCNQQDEITRIINSCLQQAEQARRDARPHKRNSRQKLVERILREQEERRVIQEQIAEQLAALESDADVVERAQQIQEQAYSYASLDGEHVSQRDMRAEIEASVERARRKAELKAARSSSHNPENEDDGDLASSSMALAQLEGKM